MSRKSRTECVAANKRRPLYLDCNATTPLEAAVSAAMMPFLTEEYGNEGSRTHEYGAKARQAVQAARDQIASLVSSRREEVVFTSGATEANNLAILGLTEYGLRNGCRHIVSSAVEHKAVLEPLQEMERRGFEVTLLPPNEGGWIEADRVRSAVRSDTLLVSIMHANNETGVIQPIEEIADKLRDVSAFFHTDAAQTFGKLINPIKHKRIDLISTSAHKVYGPKGIGALVVRHRGYDRIPLKPLFFGGGQERGLRPGTIPVSLAVGFGKAAELAAVHSNDRDFACDKFKRHLLRAFAPLQPQLNGESARTLSNVVNLCLPGINSEAAMLAVKSRVAISNGSACTSSSYEPSHVLRAMRLSDEQIKSALRFSWCHLTEHIDLEPVVDLLRGLVAA